MRLAALVLTTALLAACQALPPAVSPGAPAQAFRPVPGGLTLTGRLALKPAGAYRLAATQSKRAGAEVTAVEVYLEQQDSAFAPVALGGCDVLPPAGLQPTTTVTSPATTVTLTGLATGKYYQLTLVAKKGGDVISCRLGSITQFNTVGVTGNLALTLPCELKPTDEPYSDGRDLTASAVLGGISVVAGAPAKVATSLRPYVDLEAVDFGEQYRAFAYDGKQCFALGVMNGDFETWHLTRFPFAAGSNTVGASASLQLQTPRKLIQTDMVAGPGDDYYFTAYGSTYPPEPAGLYRGNLSTAEVELVKPTIPLQDPNTVTASPRSVCYAKEQGRFYYVEYVNGGNIDHDNNQGTPNVFYTGAWIRWYDPVTQASGTHATIYERASETERVNQLRPENATLAYVPNGSATPTLVVEEQVIDQGEVLRTKVLSVSPTTGATAALATFEAATVQGLAIASPTLFVAYQAVTNTRPAQGDFHLVAYNLDTQASTPLGVSKTTFLLDPSEGGPDIRALRLSNDRKTLYVGDGGNGPRTHIYHVDISGLGL